MSDPAAFSNSVPRDSSRPSRRSALLLTLLVALLAVAVGQYAWNHRRSELDIRLHGDMDDATSALDEVMTKTAASQRMPKLMKFAQDASPGLRYATMDWLKLERDPGVADALESAFQDSSSVVRQRAMEVLPEVDKERGFRLQIAALRDEDYWIRDSASSHLALRAGMPGSHVDNRAVPMLMKALDDYDDAVQVMSLTALKRLTGQTWRYPGKGTPAQKKAALDECRAWWAKNRAAWPAPAEWSDVAPIRPNRADPAPDFSLKDLDGNRISLEGQKGRITLINFWGTWCAPCINEIPEMVRLQKDYQGNKVDFIGIAHASGGKEEVRSWCKAHGVVYRQALSTPRMMEDYGNIYEIPVTLLIDGQGRMRYRWDGERDYATFRAAMDRLLQEPPKTP